MRQFATAVVERKKDLTGPFDTHPYECGWASEAVIFLHVEEVEGTEPALLAHVQISADGINWVKEGTHFDPMRCTGDAFVRVSHFGGWLRLTGDVQGKDARFKTTVQIVLKE